MYAVPLDRALFMDKWGRARDPGWIPVTSRNDRTMCTSGHFVDADGRTGSWDEHSLTVAKHPTGLPRWVGPPAHG
ncbi:hypothetical protein NKH18_36170 [Streptomyces sp. M10(2022)]